jgi:hypothetical protein
MEPSSTLTRQEWSLLVTFLGGIVIGLALVAILSLTGF